MIRAILAACLLALALPTHAAGITHIATNCVQANSSFTAVTTGIDTTGANFLVATITSNANGGTAGFTSFVDSKGNTWSTALDWTDNAGGDDIRIVYVQNPTTVGSAHIVTLTYSNQQYMVVCFAAYSGMLTTGVFDKAASGTGTSTSLLTSATATTTTADELLIGTGTISDGANTTFTAGASYTIRGQQGDASVGTVGFLEERIVSATGAYTASATWGGTSNPWVAGIATFAGTSAGGGGGGSIVPKISHNRRQRN